MSDEEEVKTEDGDVEGVLSSEDGEVLTDAGEKVAEEIDHIVTEEDLVANPELVEEGVEVGDQITLVA